MIIWLAGIIFDQVNIASTINQTNINFFISEPIFFKERFTLIKLIGVIITFCGVVLASLE